nr:ABC transporter ATP-binding protein [Bacilli bacterium]
AEYEEKKKQINDKYDALIKEIENGNPEGKDAKTKVNEINKQRKADLKLAAKEHKKIANFLNVKVIEMLRAVQIPNPETVARQYPHQLSGGMRQRVMIAMALACKPKILIADEPTTALDVTIQAQILKLMNDLQKTNGTSIIFITHDLGVINEMADDVVVMYCGQVVEQSSANVIFSDCKVSHPYTEGLMNSIPRSSKEHQKLEPIPGVVPHPLALPKGCKFAPRCKYATEKCMNEEPKLIEVTKGQKIRCFYPNKEERRSEQHKKIVINK